MKKILYLLPLLFIILACGAQPAPTQDVGNIVSATLTAIAQNNPQIVTLQPTLTTPAIPSTLTNTPVPSSLPPAIPTNLPPTHISTTCSASWFFTFDNKHLPLGSFCPKPVKILEAMGEDFEGGRVYRYAPDPSYTADQRGTVYVIYNDGEWTTFPDGWDASQPASDPSLVVPNGRYQPVEGIGKVWRENTDVRNRLGWAYEPQSKFLGRMQLYLVQSGIPGGDTHFFFIDHGKWGTVLLLNSVDMGPNKWEVAGSY
jgi:hypothetical protein